MSVIQRSNSHSVSCLTAHIVWSTGNITDEMVNLYLEHYRKPDDGGSNFILE